MIYHITRREAWQTALRTGRYITESLATEGFIHCSTFAQVLPVAESFYKGQGGLVLLTIEPARLTSTLKWEAPSSGTPPPGVSKGDLFPHIYGSMNLDAVVSVADLEKDPQGKFKLPISTLE